MTKREATDKGLGSFEHLPQYGYVARGFRAGIKS